MTTLAQVRDGLVTRLQTISGLRVYSFPPGDVGFPAAIVSAPRIDDYRGDLAEGGYVPVFEVAVLVALQYDQHQLDVYPYLERTGSQSIFAAIESNNTLGLSNVSALVRSARQLDLVQIGGKNCTGASIIIPVRLGD